MRFITRDPISMDRPLAIKKEKREALENWLHTEIENAIADHRTLESTWTRARKNYYAIPEHARRDVPYLNASNQVAPLAQIATDAIFATVFALILNTSPILTVKATNDKWGDRAKAVQSRIDHELHSESESTSGGLHWNFLSSLYHAGKDCTKLGTALWEVEWTEHLIKGRFARTERSGARCNPIPIENVLVPGGSNYDLHNLPWIAILHEWSLATLKEQARRREWTYSDASPAGNVSPQAQSREGFSRQHGTATRRETYDIYKIHCCYDIDDDDETEDLLIWYNHTANRIMHIEWFPYDHRNFILAHFDIEEYFFYGRGVPTILDSIMSMATDALRHWIDNEFLANCKMYKGPIQGIEGNAILAYPGKYVASNNPEQISELNMSEVYPGMAELLQVAIGFAERATGINDLSTARPAQIPGRTPATTTMQMLSQVSQRHTPFFTSFRSAAGSLVKECLYREQEQLLRGNTNLPRHLTQILGEVNASLYIDALQDSDFDNALTVELTVTSAEVNKQAEQQNALQMFQLFSTYAEKTVNAVALISNPQVPQPLRDTVQKAIIASNEFMLKVMRTFSDVSNPETFIINPVPEVQQIGQETANDPMAQIAQLLGPFGAQAPQGNGASNGGGSNGVA